MRGAMIGEDGLVVPNLSPGTEFFDRDLSPIQGSRLDFGDDAIDNVGTNNGLEETTGHSMPVIQGTRLDFGDDDDDLPDADEIENMIQAFEPGNNAENGGAAKKKGRKRTKKAKTKTKQGRRSTKKR
jgi:hypothetical protein